MYQPLAVARQTVNVLQTDSPSYEELEIITISLSNEPSLSDIKRALRQLDEYVATEVCIPRPYSDYDCTGHHFTRFIERISRTLKSGVHINGKDMDVRILVGVYFHHISVDC